MKNQRQSITLDTSDHFGILQGNLRECILRQELACEQTLFHIREYAAEIAAVCDESEEISALLEEVWRNTGDCLDEFPAISQKNLKKHRTGEQFFLRMLLFKELGALMFQKNPLFFSNRYAMQEPIPEDAVGKVACQQNHYSDRVFFAFSDRGILKSPKAVYRSTFSDICEDVYNGFAEYGILPAGNSSEGKLLRFVSLIEKYELKITASCSISSENGTTNEFVLLKKYADVSTFPVLEKSFLQFSVVPEHRETLRELLTAAEFCSLYPERLDSLPARDGGAIAYYPVFRTDGADLITFITYLSIDLPQAVPIGLYQMITEKQK